MCVCERERERARESERERVRECVCVCERERECVCVCVCMCVRRTRTRATKWMGFVLATCRHERGNMRLHNRSSGPGLKPARPCDTESVTDVPARAREVNGVESLRGGKLCTIDLGAAEGCGGEVSVGEIDGQVPCQPINSRWSHSDEQNEGRKGWVSCGMKAQPV